MKRGRITAVLLLLVTTAIWGIAGPVIKGTLSYFPPFTFLFFRFGLVFIFALPLYLWYLGLHKLRAKDFFILTIYGLMATTINLSLIFVGYDKTTALEGTLISSLYPMFIVLLGVFFLREKITKLEIAGLALVVIGSIATVFEPLFFGNGMAISHTFGNSLILLADLEWAFFVLFTKKSFDKYPPLLVILHSSIVAFLSFIPLALVENNLSLPNFQYLISNTDALYGVIYMAFLSYFVAYFLYEVAMSKIEISRGSVFAYLQPIFAAPLAVFWLEEKLTIPFLAGAAVIALGVVLSEWK